MSPMPVFEFACENCDQEFEELVLRRDEIIQCPACGSQKAKKLMSRFATTGESRLRGDACSSCRPTAGKCAGCGSH